MSDRHPSGLTEAQVWNRYSRYPLLLAKLVTLLLVVGAVYVVFRSVENVLVPVLVSLFIAYLLDPAVDSLEARGLSRTNAIFGFLAIGAALAAGFILFLYPTVSHLLGGVLDGVPQLVDVVQTQVLPWAEADLGLQVPDSVSAAIAEYGATLKAQLPTLTKAVGATLGELWTRTGAIAASLVNLVMIPIFTFYFLRDFDHMRHGLVEYVPAANREFLLDRLQKMDEVVGAWFRGQVEVALILGVLYSLGLAVVFGFAGIGVSAGLAIGLLAGLLNIVPYFGFVIGFVASVALVLLDWSGPGPLIGVVAVFAVVQALEGYVITPRIVGEKVGLSPVTVIIALLIGGEVLGLLGVLLALPVAGIARVLWPDVVQWYKSSTLYTGDVDAEG
ncbi:MAG: putative PurR-regulated permease PerM [Myxococcota bacterium]|jgi:predicted PurR-regulated permease PerM